MAAISLGDSATPSGIVSQSRSYPTRGQSYVHSLAYRLMVDSAPLELAAITLRVAHRVTNGQTLHAWRAWQTRL